MPLRTTCTRVAKYPVLVNFDTAAHSLEVGCTGQTAGQAGVYGLIFTDFKAISKIIAGSRIGIASPLKGISSRSSARPPLEPCAPGALLLLHPNIHRPPLDTAHVLATLKA